ncbi:MAG: PrsW family intramembrane metalloprotease [Chloroflexia bacterium]
MGTVRCCVCERPIVGEARSLGGRSYCPECHARVLRNRKSLWWASLAGIGVLALFVALVALIASRVPGRPQGVGLTLLGLVLALVPAALWLAVFYLQDVQEPEPKTLVVAVFVLGVLLARAVGMPLIDELFRVEEWFPSGPLYHILGAILIVGFTQQFLIYAAVRYSVYFSREFDERVDGIVYATAAGLGYATMENIDYVVRSGGVDLVSGALRIAVTAMALASFGGLVGYFLGRCKFEDEPAWWMPLGLALAAVLDGLFTYLRGEVTTTRVGLQGGGYNPWPGLLLGTAVAALTFGVLFYLIRRLERQAEAAAAE